MPKKLADEILDMRRQFDDEIGLLLTRQRAGVRSGVQQALTERRVGGMQLLKERLIQTSQAILFIQVFKRESKP